MKKAKLFMMLALLVMGVSNLFAQNVTIRGNNGSTIAAVKNGGIGDTFFATGGFATWQHEQLSMILTVSDGTKLTQSGQLDNPANNMFVSNDGKKLQIAKGKAGDATVCYVTLSLPKGYRFTGYTIQFSKPLNEIKNVLNNQSVTIDNQSVKYITINGNDESSTFGETDSSFGTYKTSATITSGGTAKTIERPLNDNMGNVLYFKLQGPSSKRALIQFESAEFFFTAEEDYAVVAADEENQYRNRSAVDIPFNTSKVDYGAVANRSYTVGNKKFYRISYLSENVEDLKANLTLYEAESTKNDTHFDGTTGKVVDYKAGSISSNGEYFKLGGVKDANNNDKEQIYYIESPTYVTLSNGVKNPIGYRIVGARFDYRPSNAGFYITYTNNGTKYYLNTNGRFTTDPVAWQIDADGYISSNGRYMYWSNNYVATDTEKPEGVGEFTIASNNRIYMTYYNRYYIRFYSQSGTNYGLITNDNYGDYAVVEPITGTNTLKIYDKTGTTADPITVTEEGWTTVENFNNDAVKIGVTGNVEIKATLTLQALDPYLDHMKVVCNDKDVDAIKLKQDFSASDFSVSGGEFFFHVPVRTKNVYITFEDLVSKYFDETYDGGKATSTSRINFVQSEHNQAFGKWASKNNNIYSNKAEAAADKSTVKERLKVGVVGTKAFKFNNADIVGTTGGTLTEYPFTFAKYAGTPNNGDFGTLEFTVTDQDQVQTRYVFTTDETRYNIAPTDAVQHRAYAFYQMIVHVQSATYVPNVEFKKIYNKTFYTDDKGEIQTHPMYAVEVTAPVEEGSDEQGYAATNDIFKIIDTAMKSSTANGTVKGTSTVKDEETGEEKTVEINIGSYSGKDAELTSAKQILNLDFSQLAGVYEITTDEHQSMDDYSATNAKNCLVFLPKGASAPNNNVAYMNDNGTTFTAANDIIITDKQPFYSPYQIALRETNKVSYTRLITLDKYGKPQNASMILPFVITLNEGTHTNTNNTSFTLHTMQATNSLNHMDGVNYGYYPAVTDVTITEANKPYLVRLTPESSNDDKVFVVEQTGSTIYPTTGLNSDYTINGAKTSGTLNDGEAQGSYDFYNKGTYAGIEVPKTPAVFYFAKNHFVSSANLSSEYKTAKILPFRTFYATQADSQAKLMSFRIIFDENSEMGTNGINEIARDADLAVTTEGGNIILMAKADNNVTIHAVNGQIIEKCNLRAGETRTVAVPAGVYVINGVKMVVK